GDSLWVNAAGLEDSPVRKRSELDAPKSVGKGMTFARDLSGMEEIRAGLLPLCDEVGTRLRRLGMFCSTVTVQIKDPRFKTISRQLTLSSPTNVTRDIYKTAIAVLEQSWSPITAPIRLLTVTATNLTDTAAAQISLFDKSEPSNPDGAKIDSVIDELRVRYGERAVSYGSLVKKSNKPIE
ncbi:MAG: DNA polymerase IV, partial [Oscillospiraceae bacterium]